MSIMFTIVLDGASFTPSASSIQQSLGTYYKIHLIAGKL